MLVSYTMEIDSVVYLEGFSMVTMQNAENGAMLSSYASQRLGSMSGREVSMRHRCQGSAAAFCDCS